MSTCIKTGFSFQMAGNDETLHGDLHLEGDLLQVRGIPRQRDQASFDAVIDAIELVEREDGSRFTDTKPGVQLLWTSEAFRDHLRSWYSEQVASRVLKGAAE